MNAPYIPEWREYAANLEFEAREAYYAAQNICYHCGGMGDHGVEPDTGCLYICYGCGGTGKYFEVAA
jgi:hypothetical protein